MKKFVFDCLNDKTKEYGLIVVIVAEDKHEALEKLSKSYSCKIRYYDSRVKEIELSNDEEIALAENEEQQSYDEVYKSNTIALGMLIASMGANICNLQRTGAGAKEKAYTAKDAYNDTKLVLNI